MKQKPKIEEAHGRLRVRVEPNDAEFHAAARNMGGRFIDERTWTFDIGKRRALQELISVLHESKEEETDASQAKTLPPPTIKHNPYDSGSGFGQVTDDYFEEPLMSRDAQEMIDKWAKAIDEANATD